MTWVIVGLMAAIVALLVLIIIKSNKVKDLELEIVHYKNEVASQTVKIDVLQHNIENLKESLQEIKEIENDKETKKKRSKKEAPPAGDSAARIDRLNSDGMQDG